MSKDKDQVKNILHSFFLSVPIPERLVFSLVVLLAWSNLFLYQAALLCTDCPLD